MRKRERHILKLGALPILLLGIFAAFKGEKSGYKIQEQQSHGKGQIERVIVNKKGESVCVGTTHNGWWFWKKTTAFFTITDARGNIIVNSTLDSRYTEGANSVIQTADGHYAIAGFKDTLLNNEQKKQAAWLVKIDEKGAILWDIAVYSQANNTFTDIAEALNGDLWLTGEMDKKLCVVSVDKTGKLLKKHLLPTASSYTTTQGNGMAWATYDAQLMIVGTEKTKKQENLLLIEFDTEGGTFDTTKTQKIPNAKGSGIVRDGWGTFGVVGTKFNEGKYGDILFGHYDRFSGIIKQKPFGKADADDEGLAIAKDEDGGFIVAGRHFEQDNDKTPQAWLYKIATQDGQKWDKPLSLGGSFSDECQSVAVSDNGRILAAGSKGASTWLIAVDFSTAIPPSNYQDIVETNVRWTMSNTYKPKGKDSIIDIGYHNMPLECLIESTDTSINAKEIHVLVNEEEYKDESRGKSETLEVIRKKNKYYYKYSRSVVLRENAKIDIKITHKGQITRSKSLKIRVKRPNLYVLAIGVDYTGSHEPRLEYTDEDAAAIVAAFKTQERFYKETKYLQLTSKDSTKADYIRKQIKTFFIGIDSTDVAVFYFAGHGNTTANGQVFVLGGDYDTLNTSTRLDYEKDIDAPLKGFNGKKYVIIDACRVITVKGGYEKNNAIPDAVTRIMRASNAYRSLLACSNGEFSYEDVCLKHGVFTYALLEALGDTTLNCDKIKLTTHSNKNVLTFEQLSKVLQDRVKLISQALSKPWQTPKKGSDKEDEDNIPFFIFFTPPQYF